MHNKASGQHGCTRRSETQRDQYSIQALNLEKTQARSTVQRYLDAIVCRIRRKEKWKVRFPTNVAQIKRMMQLYPAKAEPFEALSRISGLKVMCKVFLIHGADRRFFSCRV